MPVYFLPIAEHNYIIAAWVRDRKPRNCGNQPPWHKSVFEGNLDRLRFEDDIVLHKILHLNREIVIPDSVNQMKKQLYGLFSCWTGPQSDGADRPTRLILPVPASIMVRSAFLLFRFFVFFSG